jgi:hypothetical protein
MKNTIKMSLAAAVAVAGLTTSASAANLEDAIKGVTISGKINVEYQNTSVDATGTANDSSTDVREYDIDLTANIPVNDMITATVGVQADHDNSIDAQDSTDGSSLSATNDPTDVDVTKLYFTAKTDVATVIVGKQGQPTPFLDDERGDGVVALIPAGPVTLAAGHFTGMLGGQDLGASAAETALLVAEGATGVSTELHERDITAIAAIGTFGPVNAQAWYLNASGAHSSTATLEKGVQGYSINLAANIEGIKVELNHAELEIQKSDTVDFAAESLTKLTVAAGFEGVNVLAGYGMTNDANHNINGTTADARLHGVDLTSDNDAKTKWLWKI